MKKRLLLLVVLLVVMLSPLLNCRTQTCFASHPEVKQERIKGRIVAIEVVEEVHDEFQTYVSQRLNVEIIEGSNNKVVPVEFTSDSLTRHPQKVGDLVFLTKTQVTDQETVYNFADVYRVERLVVIVAFFIVFVVAVAGKKGFGSVVGLVVSLAVVVGYIIPQIVNGADPLTATIIGSFVIMFVTIYVAHGFSKQTTVAIIATFISLAFTVVLSKLLLDFALLTGFGTDEAFDSHHVNGREYNILGMVHAGILIATLGALDDVTTAQSAAIFALAKANKKLDFIGLIREGYDVGREHVVSLINTLIIAYVGSSLVLVFSHFVFFQGEPIFIFLNREFMAEEIVKSIAISSGLVLSMPVVTAVAAYVASIPSVRSKISDTGHTHTHHH